MTISLKSQIKLLSKTELIIMTEAMPTFLYKDLDIQMVTNGYQFYWKSVYGIVMMFLCIIKNQPRRQNILNKF